MKEGARAQMHLTAAWLKKSTLDDDEGSETTISSRRSSNRADKRDSALRGTHAPSGARPRPA